MWQVSVINVNEKSHKGRGEPDTEGDDDGGSLCECFLWVNSSSE